jgi:hypothetical protein
MAKRDFFCGYFFKARFLGFLLNAALAAWFGVSTERSSRRCTERQRTRAGGSKTADFDDVREGGPVRVVQDLDKVPAERCVLHRGGTAVVREPRLSGGPGSGRGTTDGRGWGMRGPQRNYSGKGRGRNRSALWHSGVRKGVTNG